jgi:hypothetical protein
MSLVGASVLVAATAIGASAQEPDLDSTLAFVNRTLAERTFTDDEDQTTVSEVRFSVGTLIVSIQKTKAGNRFTNVYEVALSDVDPGRIVARSRGDYLSISLGARGSVSERMECVMAGGAKTAWDLPSRTQIWVELARNAPEQRALEQALAQVITLAKADPRYGGS